MIERRNNMSKLCAAVLAAACAAAAPAAAHAVSPERAEGLARKAIAPLPVDSAVCVSQSRRRVVCFLAHPDAGGRECRSVVLLRGRRVRVLQANVCFVLREVTP
jgi:hypothetical protein